MRTSIKLQFWLFASISILLALFLWALLFVDVNLYRPQIERYLSTAFGRDIVLEGPLSLERSLTPRIVVNGLKIANPDWASRPFLAVVDKFDIRASLLPLLRGDLEIISLELHGVDLLLEEAPNGTNNFTFGESDDPTGIPAIEQLLLDNVAIAYAVPDSPVKRLLVEQITASKILGRSVTIEAQTRVNTVPVRMSLRGKPEDTTRPKGPWNFTLLGEADDLSVRIESSIQGLTGWSQSEYQLTIEGRRTDTLETLSGMTLPDAGPYQLAANIRVQPDDYLTVNDLNGLLGNSDFQGNLHWNFGALLPAVKIRIASQLLDVNEWRVDNNQTNWNRPLNIDEFGETDLDVEIRIQRLDGLARPVKDIVLTSHTDQEQLRLAVVKAIVDRTHISANMVLPWNERLTELLPEAASLSALLQHAELNIHAQAEGAIYRYVANPMEHPLDFTLFSVEATAKPDAPLVIKADATLNSKPVTINLQGESLATLLQHPLGPWQELALEVRKGDIRFNATGSVERPLETSGFEFDYSLSGTEINTLLPLFNLILPLEGAYSLTGHFADLPDRLVFDKLKIASGNNDISGDISVYQGQLRPRVVANLSSEEIHLSTLLPVSKTEAAPGAKRLVIPDYNLPIERMREIDGELDFKAKRLRTTTGELGDISFKATLQNGVLRMDPFRVRGWAGARVESELSIDVTQDPPEMSWQWIARQLNYGVLLEQAGIADTVEGTVDVTLRLSGNGRTRREFLGDADGQLVIVGQEGKFGSRQLDLWGSDLLTTMLSSSWRSEDVTDLNCVVARIGIEDGIARSDKLLIDTQRITIAATGTLDLESEALNLVFAPRPKRRSLISLTNPVHITGTLAAPETAVTVLPRNRIAAAGTGLLAGLVNPGYLIFTFSQTGSRQANRCVAAVEEAMKLKDTPYLTDDLPGKI